MIIALMAIDKLILLGTIYNIVVRQLDAQTKADPDIFLSPPEDKDNIQIDLPPQQRHKHSR